MCIFSKGKNINGRNYVKSQPKMHLGTFDEKIFSERGGGGG
jgi:hypothetical protein